LAVLSTLRLPRIRKVMAQGKVAPTSRARVRGRRGAILRRQGGSLSKSPSSSSRRTMWRVPESSETNSSTSRAVWFSGRGQRCVRSSGTLHGPVQMLARRGRHRTRPQSGDVS
jgi:hypothetical protein